jgi:hypothetical protein
MTKSSKTGKDEQMKSAIIIEFQERGAADPNIHFHGVTPAQILAAAGILRLMGERQIYNIWSAQDMERMRQQADMAQVQQMIKGDKK